MTIHELHESIHGMFQDDRIGIQEQHILGRIIRLSVAAEITRLLPPVNPKFG